MSTVTFNTYDLKEHNPFERFPAGKYVVAEANDDGLYNIHVRFDHGGGMTTIESFPLHRVFHIVSGFQADLELPNRAIWFDLPDHVLEQPSLFNRRLMATLKRKGMYWKGRKG